MFAIDRDTQLARRIYRLPVEYKSVILQLVGKCEDIRTKEVMQEHIANANNLLHLGASHEYQKLPKVKKKYYFIHKKDGGKYTIDDLAKKFEKSTKTIYYWVYMHSYALYNEYEVIRE